MVLRTVYGEISTHQSEMYEDNITIKSVIADERSILHTPYGAFILNYTMEEPRKKYKASAEFYKNGQLRAVYLEQAALIHTKAGDIPAEHITFYEHGGIHRLFPLYGQLNGYWTEENEYELAEEIKLSALGDHLICKPLCLCFYPDGNLQSVTIWNRTELTVPTGSGPIKTRHGFSVYEDGSLQSVEPVFGTVLQTKYGKIHAYDMEYNVFHADHNSLEFDRNGNLMSYSTIHTVVVLYKEKNKIREIRPAKVPDPFGGDYMVIKPMRVCMTAGGITVNLGNSKETSFFSEQDYDIQFE